MVYAGVDRHDDTRGDSRAIGYGVDLICHNSFRVDIYNSNI